jgi:hypothetical protein
MKELKKEHIIEIIGGDYSARIYKQMIKCEGGSVRGCKRMMRMFARLKN